jgi:hypothetical protein
MKQRIGAVVAIRLTRMIMMKARGIFPVDVVHERRLLTLLPWHCSRS